ncbi:CorA family divalent cation transporter [Sphingomonas sp.]|uniref:CorA family divalent cation transporter n=1 Tax=Sphingomonas sp. TaxID=28214 RepID=UPI0026031ACB|nr:CorA family divalent cation transporter [Sphingomonas sp.]MDF2494359.1 zinc transporter ZntB [Sphingomonas sp.]
MSGFGYRLENDEASKVPVRDALASEAPLVWVHLTDTAEHAQAWLRDEAKLPDYIVDPLTAQETRPRCDAIDNGAFLNLRGRTDEEMDSSDMLASVRIWITKGRVISVTRKHLLALDVVEQDVSGGRVRDPGDLIAAFATAITADLDPVVADLGDDLDDCEQQLDAKKVFALRRNVTRVRVEAISYRRFLNPQRAALEQMAKLDGDWLQPDDRAHLLAAADRAARMAEEVEAIRERASLMHEALTDLRAEQLDQRSLMISIVAMVFLPLTFITGLYGMNVEGLWFAQQPWAFDAIIGLCVAISLAVVAWFMARHWLR